MSAMLLVIESVRHFLTNKIPFFIKRVISRKLKSISKNTAAKPSSSPASFLWSGLLLLFWRGSQRWIIKILFFTIYFEPFYCKLVLQCWVIFLAIPSQKFIPISYLCVWVEYAFLFLTGLF